MTQTIVHLITGLGTGGAERQLARLAILPSKFRPVIVSMTDEGDYGVPLRKAGLTVHCLGMRRGRVSPLGFLKFLYLLWREKPVILQTWLYHADFLGQAAAMVMGIRHVVWNLRCSDMDFSRYSRLSGWLIRILARLSSKPSAIVHNSVAGRLVHERLGYAPQHWIHIPNGFDVEMFSPSHDAGVLLRRALNWPTNAILAGTIARYDAMKDFPTLLAAANLACRAHPDLRFVLIGKGLSTDNPELMAMIHGYGLGDRIALLGRRQDIATLMAGLDLVVSSSAFGEGFPNVLGEALCCGRLCVATDVGDSAQIVGKFGRVVSPGHPDRLAAAITDILALPPAVRSVLEQEAREYMRAHYAQDIMAARYNTLYHALLGQTP